ncbi:MAG: hypothetical protein RBR97_11325 [Bacteroidales bacterium]|nr:hypothetical protein [Bacteroidales bacterium]
MKNKLFSTLLLILISFGINAQSFGEAEPIYTLNGFAGGSYFGLSKSFDISSAYGEFGLQASGQKGNARFVSDLRVRSGSFFGETKTMLQLKEAFAEYSGNYFDISLGKIIVKYGKATSFNPTDNVCPKDYFFLSADIEDMQMSNFMLKTNIKPTGWLNIELLAIPFFSPSVYRYELFDMNVMEGADVSFDEYALPEVSFENMSFSARIGAEFSFADISLTGFHGYDPFYGFKIKDFNLAPPMSINLVNQAEFYKKNSLGINLSVPAGSWLITGEAAFNHTENYKDSVFIPNPDIYYVAGIEKDIWGIKIIGEYIGRYVFDFEKALSPSLPQNLADPLQLASYANQMLAYEIGRFNQKVFNQYYKTNHGVMVTFHKDFFYETLTGDLSLYYNFTTEEKLLRAAVKWKLTDELAISGGGQFMDGPSETIYDFAGNIMSGMFLSMKYSF